MGVILGLIQQFHLNQSLFVMGALFLFTFFFYYFLVIKDLTPRLVERDRRTEGREKVIFNKQKELAETLEKLEEKLLTARVEANGVLATAKLRALEKQKAILTEARVQASESVSRAQEESATTLKTELKKVSEEVPQIARKIVEVILTSNTKSRQGERTQSPGV